MVVTESSRRRSKVKLEADQKAKTSVILRGSQTRSAARPQREGKLEGKRFRETTLAKHHNARLPVMDDTKYFALQRTGRSLAPRMINEHLFLVYAKR